MHWFFIAIISPLLNSLIHHVDKFLLSKFDREHGIGSLILFSSLFPALTLPFFFLSKNNFFAVARADILILIVAGIFSALSLLFYFYALEEEETSLVAPLYQLTPIFGYLWGVLILNEIIAPGRILGAVIVILGASILSFEIEEEGGLRFRTKPTLFMIAATLVLSLNDVMFKEATLPDGTYLTSMFWVVVGIVIFGISMFLFARKYRRNFLATIRSHGQRIVKINLFNELLQTIATFTFNYAILLAPLALVLLVDVYQPLFVFVIGIILTRFFPHIATERISAKHLLHKLSAIVIVVIGSIFVYS